MRTPVIALLIGLAAVLAACVEGEPEFTEAEQAPADERAALEGDDGSGEAPADGADSAVRFVAVDIEYTEAPTEVPAGAVEFELVNEGNIQHNVVLDDLGDRLVVEAGAGETATGTVELEPGEYAFHCSIPGHEQAMQGTFTVSE